MKKGWKIFWIVCGVLACVGIVLCLAGLGLGATLEKLNDAYGWPSTASDQETLYFYEMSETNQTDPGNEDELSYTGIESLDVEAGKAAVVIQEYDGTEIKVDASRLNDKQKFSCRQDGNELEIEVESKNVSSNEGTLYIAIPKSHMFHDASLDVGGGWLSIENLNAEKLEISVGAGEVEARQFQAKELNVECGAGHAALAGTVEGKAELECGVGAMEVELDGRESDYNYSMECGIGTIVAGDSEFSGLSRKMTIDNGQNRTLEVSCGIGTVEIYFTED